jgi:hypothetical protein
VMLPDALERKYPSAATEWGWQFLFPASRVCRDPRWGPPSRFHLHESEVQKAIPMAVRQAPELAACSIQSRLWMFAALVAVTLPRPPAEARVKRRSQRPCE